MTLKKSILLIVLVLIIDQVSKFYIKTNFLLHEEIEVFDWFRILFVENEGMAWGAKIPGKYGKLALTLFRLVAITGIGYWLWDAVRKHASKTLIVSIALIFAGAMGNIIDSVFYGLIFNDSRNQVASFMPDEGGYGTLFHGKVVDMLQFPMWHGQFPEWFPFWGGDQFTFFEPVFNIADSSITIGVVLFIYLFLFNKQAFPKPEEKVDATQADL